jgi:S1-C subfamily serine protease
VRCGTLLSSRAAFCSSNQSFDTVESPQEGLLSRIVICPSCGSKGSIPDNAPAARIRCAACKGIFEVGGPAAQPSAVKPKPSGTGTRRPASASASASSSAFEDLEDVRPLAPATKSEFRRSPADSPKTSGPSPLIYGLLGVSGVAVLLLVVVLVVVLTRGGDGPAANVGNVGPVAERSDPITPVRAAAVEAPAVAETLVTPTSLTASASPSPTSTSSTAIDSQEVVRHLKDASVYINLILGDRPIGNGSGFVIEVRGDTVIVATNRHVAVPDLSDLPPSIVKKGAVLSIQAVFRSGLGPNEEQVLPAQVIAANLSDDHGGDLAFLVIKGVKKPPTPINPMTRFEPSEGMTYVAAGFPLGGMLSKVTDNKGNPSVTITGGRIAALRRDDYGQVNILQVDGSLQPGNSGGPVVDDKTGQLIGVVVAKVGSVDTIGFVIPASELRRTLAGRVGAIDLTLRQSPQGTAELSVKAQVVDPKRVVQGVVLHIAPVSAVGKLSPNADGSWPPLPNTTAFELKKDDKTASAVGQVKVSLSGKGADARKVLIQTAHRDVRGQLVYSKPKEFDLPQQPGPILQAGALQQVMNTVRRKTLSMLGALVDPDKDCKFMKDDETMKLQIEIPGGKVHSLSPYFVTRVNKKKPLHNAPMALIEVEGDFAATVEVVGDISPGSTLPKDRQGNLVPFTFACAGLVLYKDKNNFVRLERTAGVDLEKLTPIHKALIEIVKDGKQINNNVYYPLPEGKVSLYLVRRKGRVQCMFGSGSGTIGAAAQPVELDLPPKVQVGLTAGNISAKPFTAVFENFALLSDVTKIDAMFGK